MKLRDDFDYAADCGVWLCRECERPFYPVELEHNDRLGESFSPCCDAMCRRATADEVSDARNRQSARNAAETLRRANDGA